MNILFVGAGGSGMGAIVRWHLELGDTVFIQDDGALPEELLKKYPKARLFEPSAKFMADLAVFSDAIPPQHFLRSYARENNISTRSYAEELGALSAGRPLIAIAGTHGKSTTTALISWALTAANLDPLCVIGAEIKEWESGFRFGHGPVVVEADEFRKHFLRLSPSVILITSLEADHFDTYANEDAAVKTFVEFCAKKSVESIFIARGTLALDRLSEELAKLGRSHVRFGGKDDVAYCSKFEIKEGRSHATVSINQAAQELELQSTACPHILNIVGAVAVLAHVAVPPELLAKSIGSFPGILRRLELLGKIGGVPVYSDYAHHPTAVRETLRILRQIFPHAKIAAIFEPHERLRTSTLRAEYETAFESADIVGLLPVYDPIGRQRPDISDDATRLSPTRDTFTFDDYGSALAWANDFATNKGTAPADEKIIVIMGAGPIDGAFRKSITG